MRWLSFVLAFALLPLLTTAQETQDADLETAIDTTDNQDMTPKGGPLYGLTDAQLHERLSYLSGCLDLKVNGVVKGYIRNYVVQKPEKARTMLGKRLTYFPLFEQKLKEQGLPTDLKYLAVVESALNPKAVSRVGATGLWQFMPATGSDYGLRTNSAVEERSNPVKSTEAAARYLKALFTEYQDWALALAAYNSGQGRVDAAIRKARSRNFWVIQRFLPDETRNYVPAFIAATYLCNYYQMHGLDPNEPDYDEQLTSHLKVYEGISFRDIAAATGVPYNTIKNLNPGFRRDYVPPSSDGHYVVMPERVMPAFVRYLNSIGSRSYTFDNMDLGNPDDLGNGRYWQSFVYANSVEHVDQLASKFGLSGTHLKCWNNLNSNFVQAGSKIKIWHPVYVLKHTPGARVEAPLPDKKAKPQIVTASKPAETSSPSAPAYEERPKVPAVAYHTVQRNESQEDIARKYGTT
ncbi:MAG TPA: transglycosylase SLT domain-containing protein, partial [Saprospiraceae bacterium]|nr:transglycosylase SLT domain-containing protein [Saprospiraceae bacterium]